MNTSVHPMYVLVKALCLFVLVNVVYGLIDPPIADISVYNVFIPGLKRMPFGDYTDPYTVTVDNADTMFAAHEISAKKEPDEIRIALIGDSSIWGDSLSLGHTLSGQWNQLGSQCNGKKAKVYNLGYPHPSVIKDLIFLEEVQERQPDVIVWFITLNTLTNQYQVNPFLTGNRERALQIMDTYDIPFAPRKVLTEKEAGFYQKTLIGQRSFLARWLKLQALGLVWSATGDGFHVEPDDIEPPASDVAKDPQYRSLEPGSDLHKSLLLEAFSAGKDIAGEIPVLVVNEPIYVATGIHSDIRYNGLYPRWAYDQYRELVIAQAQTASLTYLDMWNAIPPEFFTDTPLHLSVAGERLFAEQLDSTLLSMICP